MVVRCGGSGMILFGFVSCFYSVSPVSIYQTSRCFSFFIFWVKMVMMAQLIGAWLLNEVINESM